MRGKNMYYKI